MFTRYSYYQEVMQGCDVAEVLHLKTRLVKSAKIQHACHGCDKPIEVGQTYWYTVYLVDGELTYQKRHTLITCD